MATLGRSRLDHKLAVGGMGEVWAATDTATELPVALKVVPALSAPGATASFADEVRAVARLDHPHVVRVFEQGRCAQDDPRWPDSPWLSMERAASTLAEDAPDRDWPEVFRLLQELLSALSHAHARGVVHRDVKASNVLLRADGSVALADFGIARLGPESLDAGTPGWMAPEQLRGQRGRQGPRTDLYAVGCLAWHLLTRAPVFGDDATAQDHLHRSPPALTPSTPVPEGVEAWVHALLEKDPLRRPESAAQAAAQLRALHGPWTLTRRPAPALRGVGASLVGLRPVPLVERAEETTRLRETLRRVEREGRAEALVLSGPSGMGKTRLALELCWWAREQGLAALFATHGAEAREGLVVALATSIGDVPVDRALAARGAPPRDRSALSDLLADPTSVSEAALRRVLIVGALQDFAFGGALVLVLDDAQWAPRGLEVCKAVVGSAFPILLVLTVQDEASRGEPETAAMLKAIDAERIALDALPTDAVAEAVLGLDDAAATALAQRSAGNPLMAVQLVSDWVRRGLLVPSPRGYDLAEGADPGMPPDLEALWTGRLEGVLEGVDASSIELAAAGGLEIDASRWERVCARAGIHPDEQALERLLQAGLALRDGDSWRLVHAMAREALNTHARRKGRWSTFHAAWAEVAVDEGLAPGRIGHHRVQAGDLEGALAPLETEVERLWRQGAFSEVSRAISLWGEAAAGRAETSEIFGRMGLWRCRLALVREGVDAAAERVEELASHANAPDWALDEALDLQRCHHRWMRGALDEALELARNVAGSSEPRLALQGGRDTGRLLAALGRHQEARSALEKTLAEATASGDTFVACVCLDGLAEASIAGLDLEAVRAFSQRQEALCSAHGFRVWEASARFWPAFADLLDGRPAIDALGRCRAESQGLGQPTCHTVGALAVALATSGESDRAFALFDEALAEARELGWNDTAGALEAYRLVLACDADDVTWDKAARACEALVERTADALLDVVLRHVEVQAPSDRARRAEALSEALRRRRGTE